MPHISIPRIHPIATILSLAVMVGLLATSCGQSPAASRPPVAQTPSPIIPVRQRWHNVIRPGRGSGKALYAGELIAKGAADQFLLPPLPMAAKDLSLTVAAGTTFLQIASLASLGKTCQTDTVYVSLTARALRFCTPPPPGTVVRVVLYPSAQYIATRCARYPSARSQAHCLKTPITPTASP